MYTAAESDAVLSNPIKFRLLWGQVHFVVLGLRIFETSKVRTFMTFMRHMFDSGFTVLATRFRRTLLRTD